MGLSSNLVQPNGICYGNLAVLFQVAVEFHVLSSMFSLIPSIGGMSNKDIPYGIDWLKEQTE